MAGCCGRGGGGTTAITAGDNVTITGAGTSSDPFVISSAGEPGADGVDGEDGQSVNVIMVADADWPPDPDPDPLNFYVRVP